MELETGRPEANQSTWMALTEGELRDWEEPAETGLRKWLVLGEGQEREVGREHKLGGTSRDTGDVGDSGLNGTSWDKRYVKISSSKYLHVSEASSSSPSVMGTWVGLSSMPSYSITFSCAWPDLVRLRLWGDNGLSRGFYRWLLCRGGHGLSVCSGLWRDGRLGSESGVGLATSSTGQMVKANPQFTSTTPQNVAKLSIHAFHSEGLIPMP